jgi:hypothetical protein
LISVYPTSVPPPQSNLLFLRVHYLAGRPPSTGCCPGHLQRRARPRPHRRTGSLPARPRHLGAPPRDPPHHSHIAPFVLDPPTVKSPPTPSSPTNPVSQASCISK